MKIQEVLCALETFAPLPLQEAYDNAGLQVGLTEEQDVTGALLCLDVTEDVIEEAANCGYNLIVSHHPLLFRGLKRISVDGNSVEKCVIKAIKNNVAIISMHTNLDNVKGGVNYKIAEKLQLLDVEFLQPLSRCGYEGGSGIIGNLTKSMPSEDFIDYIKKVFNTNAAICTNSQVKEIKRVAVCGGAGSFLIEDAKKAKADAFITGEMHYHEYFEATDDIIAMAVGHYETEQYTQELLQEILLKSFPEIKTKIYGSTNPITIK